MSDVSKSLRSLTKNELPWAIRSGRSDEMSDCEQIAQVAHQKWANEWIAHFFEQIAHSIIFPKFSFYFFLLHYIAEIIPQAQKQPKG